MGSEEPEVSGASNCVVPPSATAGHGRGRGQECAPLGPASGMGHPLALGAAGGAPARAASAAAGSAAAGGAPSAAAGCGSGSGGGAPAALPSGP